MSTLKNNLNWEGFIPFSILLVFFCLNTNTAIAQDEQFRTLKFGLTFGTGYFPAPELINEVGEVPFDPGKSFDFNYGFNLNYDLNRFWKFNLGLNMGGYPIASHIYLKASDYPGCLDYDIDESKMRPITVDFLDLYFTTERSFFVESKYNFSAILGGSLKTVPNGIYNTRIIYQSNVSNLEKHMLTVSVTSNPQDQTLWGGIFGIGHYFNLFRNKDTKFTLLYNISSANIAEGYYEILLNTDCYTAGKYNITGKYISLNLTYILGRPHKEKRIRNNDNSNQ